MSQATIAAEVQLLRRYLAKPRELAAVAEQYGWCERTAIRRMHEVGRVWRVVPAGHRTARYVVAPKEWGDS